MNGNVTINLKSLYKILFEVKTKYSSNKRLRNNDVTYSGYKCFRPHRYCNWKDKSMFYTNYLNNFTKIVRTNDAKLI